MIYILPLLFTFLCAVVCECREKKLRVHKPLFILILTYCVLLMAFRYRVGGDTLRYMDSYRFIPDLMHINLSDVFSYYYTDPLYTLLCSFAKLFGKSFYIFQLFHACLLNYLIGRFIVHNTKNILFALFFYMIICFLYFNTEILRESLAVAVFVNSVRFLEKKQWIFYYMLCFIALGFHVSAIVTFFLPFFYTRKVGKRHYLFFLGVLICLFCSIDYIVEYIRGDLAFEYLSKKGSLMEGLNFNVNWYIVNLSKCFLCPLLFVLFYRRSIASDNEVYLFFYMFFGACLLVFPIVFSRFCNYFLLFFVVIVADVSDLLLRRKNMHVAFSFAFLLLVYGYDYKKEIIADGFNYYRLFYPYSDILEQKMDQFREKCIYFQYM